MVRGSRHGTREEFRGRARGNGFLGDGGLEALPENIAARPGADSVRLIDVLWIDPQKHWAAAGFEVEHTTSIFSGIARLLNLALGGGAPIGKDLFLVARNGRQDDVCQQLMRPTFSRARARRPRRKKVGSALCRPDTLG